MEQKIFDNLIEIIQNRNADKVHDNTATSYVEIDNNISNIDKVINQFDESLNLKDKIIVKKEKFSCNVVKTLTREEIIKHVLGFDIFKDTKLTFDTDENIKASGGVISNRLRKVNVSLAKYNKRVQTISHKNNEYKILTQIPDGYFKN